MSRLSRQCHDSKCPRLSRHQCHDRTCAYHANLPPEYDKVIRWIAENPGRDGKDVKHRNHLRAAETQGYVQYTNARGWHLTRYGRIYLGLPVLPEAA